MRVVCQSVEEFVADLSAAGDLFQNVVRFSVLRHPVGGNRREAVRFDVVVQASAVVNVNAEEQYLLEVGEDCGTDYLDSSQELKGSERAEVLRREITAFCGLHGWTVRSGMIEL